MRFNISGNKLQKYFPLFILLAACSNQHLDKAELGVPIDDTSLTSLSDTAGRLSKGYAIAAQNTQSTQDVFAFLTVTSAATAISGIASSAANSEIAAAAIAGTAAQQGGARLAPRAAIEAIFDGAKRMNCVSAVAALGESMLPESADKDAGIIATRWAIEHVRILTREELTRDSVKFTEIFAEYQGSVETVAGAARSRSGNRSATPAAGQIRAVRTKPGEDFTAYLELLDKCTNTTALPITTAKPKE